MLRKHKISIVLIQILVELYGEFTDKLGRSFYFLRRLKKKEQMVSKAKKSSQEIFLFNFYYVT